MSSSSDDVLKFLYQEMRDLDQEVFKVIILNGQNHILKILEVAKGSLTAAQNLSSRSCQTRTATLRCSPRAHT